MKIRRKRIMIFSFSLIALIAATIFLFLNNIPQIVRSESSSGSIDDLVIKDEYIMTFDSDAAKIDFAQRHQSEIIEEKKLSPGVYSFKFQPDKKLFYQRNQANLEKESGVAKAEPNHLIRAFLTPNDTNYNSQNHLPQIKAPSGWEMTTGNATTVIASIDTGVKLDHADLNDKIWTNPGETGGGKETDGIDNDGNTYVDDWRGWNFYSSNNNPTDDHGHGTATIGVSAAETNNAQGVAGVDWSAKIMPLKILNSQGWGSEDDLILAINYARVKGAEVISMSLGADGYTQPLKTAVDDAVAAGLVLVAASGNTPYCSQSGNVGVNWPAAFSNVIAVGSVNSSDSISAFSCTGPEVDLTAPGESTYTTLINGSYGVAGSGTSLSTPQVSGLAGLILAKYPTLTLAQVRTRIIDNADKVSGMGWNNKTNSYGYGRVNIFRALLRVVRGPDTKVWLISLNDSQKHWVPDTTTFNLWRLSNNQIENLNQGQIDAFVTSTNISYLLKDSTPNYYLIDYGLKKKFYNANYLTVWGFSAEEAIQFDDIFISGFSSGKNLIRLGQYGSVYLIDAGRKYRMRSHSFYSDWNIPSSQVVPLTETFLDLIPTQNWVYRLARRSSTSPIYLINKGKKIHVTSPAQMAKYGFSWSEVAVFYSSFLNYYPASGSLSELVKGSGAAVYHPLAGRKRWIVSPDTLTNLGFSWNQIRTISNYNLAHIAMGQKLTRLVKDSGPPVYYVENHTIRHIPSPQKFAQYGFSWSDVVTVPYSYLKTFPNGQDM